MTRERGKFGLKINTFQAGSVYEVAIGVRDRYDYKPAMLCNSLFLDFLKENGLEVHNNDATRDIICLDFSYGSASYEETRKRIEKKAKEHPENAEYYAATLARIEAISDRFDKRSRERLREIFYRDGLSIFYPIFEKKEVVGHEEIRYRMAYRTPGKAKRGLCMFVREELHPAVMEFLRMGLELPDQNAQIVEMGAYSSLITSTIEARIKIDPDEILVLKDVDVPFVTNVVSIEINEFHECIAVPRADYTVQNELFDGQALIDESIFPGWADGYILLRHHFTKCAAFCTKIQKFFQDYCKKNKLSYENFEVFDMFGRAHLAKNIKLITTDNAFKWMKFKVTYDYWAGWVRKNGSVWGIVKTAHPSKLGEVQRMSYQMVNALDLEKVASYMERSVSYVEKLKSDDRAFLSYLRRTANYSNDHEVMVALAEWNPDFLRTDYFRNRKKTIIHGYTKKLNAGRIIQNADNLVIVGSPYAMLLHSVGEDPTTDPTFEQEDGAIQCWTGRFKNDEYLAGFRSPYNCQCNMDCLHNVYHEYFDKYFNLGRLIIAVNLNGSDFQDRSNGSDQDSDSLYVTNHPDIVDHALYCYKHYPTTVNNIPKESKSYSNTPEDFATVDNILAHAQRNIGESSNLAQICLSYAHTYDDQRFVDYTYILAVLAQCAIDGTKRTFDIDITNEIKRIKDDMDVKTNGYPEFWKYIRRDFNHTRINPDIKCPMNEVSRTIYRKGTPSSPIVPFSDLFVGSNSNGIIDRESKKVRAMINKYSLDINSGRFDDSESDETDHAEYLLALDNHEEFIEDLRQVVLGRKYRPLVMWLMRQAFCNKNIEENYKGVIEKTRPLLMKVLYDVNMKDFLACFKAGCK